MIRARAAAEKSIKQPDDFLWRQLRRVDDHLTHELLKHAKRLYGYEGFETAWEAYAGGDLDDFDVDSPHNQVFFPWYLYNWRAESDETEDDSAGAPTIAESRVVGKIVVG